MCTTKKKPYSTITLDFGAPVEISKVEPHSAFYALIVFLSPKNEQLQVAPNFPYPQLSEARIIISNNTVPVGSRADEGIEKNTVKFLTFKILFRL